MSCPCQLDCVSVGLQDNRYGLHAFIALNICFGNGLEFSGGCAALAMVIDVDWH
jgi:hypothetical protein